jgi:Tol biopolymer transport system component
MAPEQIRGAPVTARTDEYALGVVLYECLSGRLPFSAEGSEDYMAQSLFADPKPLTSVAPDVPVDLARLIHLCLERIPARRPESATKILDELRRISDQAGSLLTVRTIRNRRLAWAGAVVAAVALAAVSWSLWYHPNFSGLVGQHRAVVTGANRASESRVSPDGGWMLFRAWDAGHLRTFVQALDSADRSLAATPVDHPDGAESFAWSPNGRELAYVLDAPSGGLLQIIPAFFGGRPRLNIEIDRASRVLRWVDEDTIILRRRTNTGPTLSRLSLSTGVITAINLEWLGASISDSLDISPAGDRIAYCTMVGRRSDLWVARLDGSDRRQLTDDEAFDRYPVWNADGRSVVYQSNRNGQADLWEVDIRSGQSVPLTTSDTVDTPGSMSADGRFLSFSREAVDAQIWRWRSDEPVGQPLTFTSLGSFSPALASDSRTMLLQRGDPLYVQGSTILNSSLMIGELGPGAFETQPRSVADGFAGFLSPNRQWLAFLRRSDTATPSILAVKELGTERTMSVSTNGPLPAYRDFPIDWAERSVAWHPDSGSVFYSEGLIPGPLTLRRFALSGEAPGEPLDTGGERELFRDLHPTPDGRGLAYLFWSKGVFTVRYLDLATGTRSERAQVTAGVNTVWARGWIDGGTTLVLLQTQRPVADGAADVDVLLINEHTGLRFLRTVTSAFATTARVDAGTRALYLTRSIEGVHNVFAVPLDGTPERELTRNTIEGPTFSGVNITANGSIVGVRGTRTHNIWVIDTRPNDTARSSK